MAVSKTTPKSCGCRSCRRGKHTSVGGSLVKFDERAFRHAANQALRQGREPMAAAPIGNYYD